MKAKTSEFPRKMYSNLISLSSCRHLFHFSEVLKVLSITKLSQV